jgi:hypothetical protein
MGGALGAAPGVCLLVPGLVKNTAEPFPFHLAIPAALFVIGATAGVLTGVHVMDRAMSHARSRLGTWATSLAALVLSAVIALPTAALTGNRWEMWTWFILAPLSMAAATIAGYSLAPSFPPGSQESDLGRMNRGGETPGTARGEGLSE